MNLELIAPAREETISEANLSFFPPLNLAIVAALTPRDVEVCLIDENLTPIDFEKKIDLVGITATTLTAPRAYEIADLFRKKGVKVVFGGIHPTFLPEEVIEHADSVVLGEAEGVWPKLIADFKKGKLKKFYQNGVRSDLIGLPLPRRDLFAQKGYVLPQSLFTTRGCPFSCDFCSVTSFFGHTYRYRPLGEVLKEIRSFKGREIFFVDDNIIGNLNYAKELFSALVPEKIQWVGQASINIGNNEELLRLAAASGCVSLFIGFESLSPTSLASVGKKHNVIEEYEQVIVKIHSFGISIFGAFIFGLDGDREDIFEQTVHFAQKAKLEGAQFNVLTPFPGTRLHETLDKAGRIITKDWSRYNMTNVVFKPKLIPRETLEKGHHWAWREFYSLPSIWQRIGLSHPHLRWAWTLNLNFRRHWKRKSLSS